MILHTSDRWRTEITKTLRTHHGDKAAKRAGLLNTLSESGQITVSLCSHEPCSTAGNTSWHIIGASNQRGFVRLSLPNQIAAFYLLECMLATSSADTSPGMRSATIRATTATGCGTCASGERPSVPFCPERLAVLRHVKS